MKRKSINSLVTNSDMPNTFQNGILLNFFTRQSHEALICKQATVNNFLSYKMSSPSSCNFYISMDWLKKIFSVNLDLKSHKLVI